MGGTAGRVPRGTGSGVELVIFITVGTHGDPFDRLIEAAEALAQSGETVVVQRGTSRVEAPNCEVHDFLPPSEMAHLIRQSRILISHAGPASFLGAPGVPIVVPRRAEFGEHVDNHQVRFVQHIRDRVHVVDDPATLVAAIARHDEVVSRIAPNETRRTERFARDFGRVVDEVVSRAKTGST